MVRWLDYVPEGVKAYVKLLAARRRYPGCRILSPLILPGAKLGVGCVIAGNVAIGSRVSVGDHSYINSGSIVASGSIGKFCSIGYLAQIGLPNHPVDFISTSPRTYGAMNMFGSAAFWNDYPAPPIIENDVWIGSQVASPAACSYWYRRGCRQGEHSHRGCSTIHYRCRRASEAYPAAFRQRRC